MRMCLQFYIPIEDEVTADDLQFVGACEGGGEGHAGLTSGDDRCEYDSLVLVQQSYRAALQGTVETEFVVLQVYLRDINGTTGTGIVGTTHRYRSYRQHNGLALVFAHYIQGCHR